MAVRATPTERMVKPSEAADLLGVHHNTVLGWIREGRVPYVKTPGGHYLLPWTLLMQSLRGTYDLTSQLPEKEASEEEAVELSRR
jgi:excisionase family DNA binding protein